MDNDVKVDEADKNYIYGNCPICGQTIYAYEGMRKDAKGVYWCKIDQDEFDSIDWEEVYEYREGNLY